MKIQSKTSGSLNAPTSDFRRA